MSAEIYRYQFATGVPARDIEETLHLAVLAAECLHGEARVRLDASYCMDADKRACVIDGGTEVGRDTCRIFTGFAMKEFGQDAFKVERLSGSERSCPRPDPKGVSVG